MLLSDFDVQLLLGALDLAKHIDLIVGSRTVAFSDELLQSCRRKLEGYCALTVFSKQELTYLSILASNMAARQMNFDVWLGESYFDIADRLADLADN